MSMRSAGAAAPPAYSYAHGALPLGGGTTRFRLWAPTAPPGLALEIEGRPPIALRRDAKATCRPTCDAGRARVTATA
ncbi:hypothetical protein AD428_16515, partial [Achromobacter sp. DMS1]